MARRKPRWVDGRTDEHTEGGSDEGKAMVTEDGLAGEERASTARKRSAASIVGGRREKQFINKA